MTGFSKIDKHRCFLLEPLLLPYKKHGRASYDLFVKSFIAQKVSDLDFATSTVGNAAVKASKGMVPFLCVLCRKPQVFFCEKE